MKSIMTQVSSPTTEASWPGPDDVGVSACRPMTVEHDMSTT
jgi:hypothetical protein